MSVSMQATRQPTRRSTRSRLARTGVVAVAAAAGLAAYAAFGDPHPKTSQEHGVPFLIAVSVVVGTAVFGLLVPRALQAVRAASPGAPRWALGHGIAAVVLLTAFWSGLPLIVGPAAVIVGAEGRRWADRQSRPRGLYSAGLVLGVIAVTVSIAVTVVSNTVGHH